MKDHYYESAFSGIKQIYGENAVEKLSQIHIAIIGLGGIGSWAAESLARSGVGKITLVDLDDICFSNINRQVQALSSTAGQLKIEVMKKRIMDINPHCQVYCHHCFYSEKTADKILSTSYDFIIDAFDYARLKTHLIIECLKKKQKLLVIGGAAGRVHPELIKITDIAHSCHDPLLFKIRKDLKQNHGRLKLRSQNKVKKLGIPCVFSTEKMPPKPSQKEGINQLSKCDQGAGSLVSITATFANYAVSYILNQLLLRKNLKNHK